MTNYKVLVTGGSGFIGTNLVGRLKGLGFDVLSLDVAAPRNRDNLDVHRYCDICDVDLLAEAFESFRPDYVFHLAARTDLRGKSLDDYRENIAGVDNLCAVLSSADYVKHAVFASSMLVCRAGHIPATIEDVSPTTVYGKSKVEGERIVRQWMARMPKCSIVRPTSIWGAWFGEPYRNFFDMVLAGRYIRIGRASSTKTYGYVENCVNQIISIAQRPDDSVEYFYIGDAVPLNVDEWSLSIASHAGRRKPIKAPMFFFYCLAWVGDLCNFTGLRFPFSSFRLKNMTTHNVVDCAPAEKSNVYPVVGLQEGIEKTLSWLKASSTKE
ncbi:NAD(P)-dependent oxidoreductase [Pseudomonas sp. CBZ-4]|uniref:NAD-dependent epimerase/dehydratase family protein n=1 Tax=Pseudomonas sp. CBZ-4 TaxID=1163065 RepID=UPI0003799D92|nr:NAD(P)-dependent oxidoreductase [Pseudomonas sp. CBZ-4]